MIKKYIFKSFCCVLMTIAIVSSFSCDGNAAADIGNQKKGNNSLPMLWDFGAKKCIPCKKMAPLLDKLAEEYKGRFIVKFTDVWMSENVQLAKQHGIQSIPTQIFFDENEKELWRHVGFFSKDNILSKWKSLGYDFSHNRKETKTTK